MNTQDLLARLGFTTKECKIYINIIQNPKISYNQLSVISKVNRTTCYSVVKKLLEKGLITQDLGSKVVKLIAKDPEALIQLQTQIASRAKKNIEIASRAKQELLLLIPNYLQHEPKITYIEESEIESFFIKRSEIWAASTAKTRMTVWGFEDSLLQKKLEGFILNFWNIPITKNLRLKLFMDTDEYIQPLAHIKASRQFRFWRGFTDFTSSTLVYGDFVIMVSIDAHPSYAIEINDPLLAENLAKFFEIVWSSTENLPGLGKTSQAIDSQDAKNRH